MNDRNGNGDKKWYGAQAVLGFGRMLERLANEQGRGIKFEFANGTPCTDGGTIRMMRGPFDRNGFVSQCGIMCHEFAHVYFESNQIQRGILDDYPPPDQKVAAFAFNVIIDIADETRFTRAFPYSEELFTHSQNVTLDELFDEEKLPRTPPAQATVWQMGAAVIAINRSPVGSEIRRKRFRGWRTRTAGMKRALRIGAWAIDKSKLTRDCPPLRTEKEMRQMRRLVRELVDVFKAYADLDSPLPNDPFAGARKKVSAQAQQAYQQAKCAGDRGAVAIDWKEALPATWKEALSALEKNTSPGSRSFQEPSDQVGFDDSVCARLRPVFRKAVRRLVTDDVLELEKGHLSGRLVSPVRAMIPGDGRAFGRRTYQEGVAAAVAVLCDCSHSTRDVLPGFLPVATALAEALKEQPDVDVAIWRYGGIVERVSTAEMRAPKLMGNTNSGMAMAEARQWLSKSGATNKIVLLFTDGRASDHTRALSEAVLLRRAGVKLLIGAMDIAWCTVAFPGAAIFNVHPDSAAASLKAVVTRISARA